MPSGFLLNTMVRIALERRADPVRLGTWTAALLLGSSFFRLLLFFRRLPVEAEVVRLRFLCLLLSLWGSLLARGRGRLLSYSGLGVEIQKSPQYGWSQKPS